MNDDVMARWQAFRAVPGPIAALDEAAPLVCRADDGKPDVVLANGRHFYFGLERE